MLGFLKKDLSPFYTKGPKNTKKMAKNVENCMTGDSNSKQEAKSEQNKNNSILEGCVKNFFNSHNKNVQNSENTYM